MDIGDLLQVYDEGDEDARMASPRNQVEWVRTRELLVRWLPSEPSRILDVGGASGRYAAWLSEQGHVVQVVDPVPKHVEQARARGLDAVLGDARDLPCPDASVDVVMMLGPLYHLPAAEDRERALAEAVRCVVPGGVVVVAAMSRWAKPSVRAARGELSDLRVRAHLLRVLQHGHDAEGDEFDRVSYNHDPEHLRGEMRAAGLADVQVVGIEGPLGAQAREDPGLVETALSAARIAEEDAPHVSIHLLARGAVAGRPRGTTTTRT